MVDTQDGERASRIPTIHIISDSIGATAGAMARAAAAQFGVGNPRIETLPKVKSFDQVRNYLDVHAARHEERVGDNRMLVFYTLVDREINEKVSAYLENHPNIVAVDLITGAVAAIAQMSGLAPANTPGSLRAVDMNYFRRMEAIEFTIAHDDGRNPQDLAQADIVLIGVSRSSKTPLSIYLSQQGYRVANVPLDPDTEPPHQIYDVDKTRLFGLMTTPEVLAGIRERRLGNSRERAVAGRYAELDYVYEDLERARALMRKLGCIVVRTDHRAVEESAAEILQYYERSHPESRNPA